MTPSGYYGTLCMRCKHNYYAASGSCIQCKGVGLPQWVVKALAFVPQQHGIGFWRSCVVTFACYESMNVSSQLLKLEQNDWILRSRSGL